MTQDEVIGLFYQEFCQPTLAEEKILDGLKIGDRIIINKTISDLPNIKGKTGYILGVEMEYKEYPISVNLKIGNEFIECRFKRDELDKV
jgi:hypothetical protein